ncbi:protein sorting system archaetidylserine decarboxylase [Natronobeatus ordinarius]|uniref:protein sorting system archaetidylserine decarboxylase n=1 Tax=Natronobeatus ordinarius TaxID=2963433 RepID=UPI0020CBAFEF|nr:protein sorting system archaetidylserine decarboxylase [Natronobeatus ordinarius]
MKFAPGAWRYAIVPLLAAPFALIFSVTASVLALALGAFVLLFFRDPERTPPPTGVVSPADGTVSVRREEEEQVRLGVFMNVWHVHVVRAPFDGVVESVEHVPGAHKPAFSKDSDRNERVHVRFAPEDPADGPGSEHDVTDALTGPREVTLVAGAFARRIYPYVEPGDELERGDRIGHIAFGSRVDVCVPRTVNCEEFAVDLGESVTAGETVVLETARPSVGSVDDGSDETTLPDDDESRKRD